MMNKLRCKIFSRLKICCLIVFFCMFHLIFQSYDISSISCEVQISDLNDKHLMSTLAEDITTSTTEENEYGRVPWINNNYSLVLFTTFNLLNANAYHIYAHNIVIRNWAQFLPDVQPVLFADTYSHPLVKLAEKHKWRVFATPSVNQYGTPHLKPMYDVVFRNFNSTFYAFANGDNFFDSTLLKTMDKIKSKLAVLKNNVMIVGRRYSIDGDLDTQAEEYITGDLKPIIVNVTQEPVYAEDYFIFTRDNCSLNWTKLANVVIGRRGYDNYLVAKAIEAKVNVIDASKTIIDVHLKQPNVSFGSQNRIDHRYNLELIGKFDFTTGRTHKIKLYTDYTNSTDKIGIFTRKISTSPIP